MCFCCKTTEQIYQIGLKLSYQVSPGVNDSISKLSKSDIKTFIQALKVFKRAADDEHPGASYQFGLAVWKCINSTAIEAIDNEFSDTFLEQWEFFALDKPNGCLDFHRALAQKYLRLANNSQFPGAEHALKQIKSYAQQKNNHKGEIDLTASYQGNDIIKF